MSSPRRRTVLRSAAVAAFAGGALLTPAVAAVADTPSRTEGTRTVAPTAPEGGVKAGTEGFHSGDPVFIAAGGAMAAAGAAGLGYAMLRRGRTDA